MLLYKTGYFPISSPWSSLLHARRPIGTTPALGEAMLRLYRHALLRHNPAHDLNARPGYPSVRVIILTTLALALVLLGHESEIFGLLVTLLQTITAAALDQPGRRYVCSLGGSC